MVTKKHQTNKKKSIKKKLKKTKKKKSIKKKLNSTQNNITLNAALTQTRPLTSLSLDTINAIHLITLDPEFSPTIVGSFKYVVHEYPADIDMFETYKSCCSLTTAKKDIADKFKHMAKRIQGSQHIYLGDFKAGFDQRYYIDIGSVNGSDINNYHPENIKIDIYKLKETNLLTAKECNDLLAKVVKTPKLKQFYDLESQIKKKYVVRWKLDEMVKGKKLLPLDVEITLAEALTHKSIVKIDIWVYLNQRYIEMTNMFMLTFNDTKHHLHNLSVKPEAYELSLMEDLHKYSNRSINKYMKLAKRLWVYAVLKGNTKIMKILYPLFSSSASKMYQITGEIETIVNILEHIQRPLLSSIKTNIEDWKTRLGTVMIDTLPIAVANDIFTTIDSIVKKIHNKEFVITHLEELSDTLVIYINKYVKKFLIKNKLLKNNIIKV
jgi:hypothetical protein